VYRNEHVVIGPANYSYAWVALVKEHCTAMALQDFIPMPQGGSRKGGTFGAWFSELAKKELAGRVWGFRTLATRKSLKQEVDQLNRNANTNNSYIR
jgi:hypothetical protein